MLTGLTERLWRILSVLIRYASHVPPRSEKFLLESDSVIYLHLHAMPSYGVCGSKKAAKYAVMSCTRSNGATMPM